MPSGLVVLIPHAFAFNLEPTTASIVPLLHQPHAYKQAQPRGELDNLVGESSLGPCDKPKA